MIRPESFHKRNKVDALVLLGAYFFVGFILYLVFNVNPAMVVAQVLWIIIWSIIAIAQWNFRVDSFL